MIARRAFLAVGAFMAVMALATALAALAYAHVQERQTTYRYFSEAMTAPVPSQMLVAWAANSPALDRPLPDADKAVIGRAVAEAWRAFATALDTGSDLGLADHFSGSALARATEAATAAKDTGARMAVLRQTLTPVFLHSDGSVLQIEAEALVARYAVGPEGPAFLDLTRDRTVTILTNETTGWRVFAHERRAAIPAEARIPVSVPRMTGINYYPAATPWTRFWDDYSPEVIDADLARIRDLGGNSVRVFLPRDLFLSTETSDLALGRLRDFLSRAHSQDLIVVPTLFDMRSGYAPAVWADDTAYLAKVLPVLAASPAVRMVDIKNEPDLDFERAGKATVLAWIGSMAAVINADAPNLALTVGWSRADAATLLADRFDVITYHDFQPDGSPSDRLAALRAALPGRQIMVTEVGATSFDLAVGFPSSERHQADAIRGRLTDLAGADGLFVWTLHDFPEPDAKAVGRSPWRRALQSQFGLIGSDGRDKPSAEVVRAAFTNFKNGVSP